jgi:hypothetical protein
LEWFVAMFDDETCQRMAQRIRYESNIQDLDKLGIRDDSLSNDLIPGFSVLQRCLLLDEEMGRSVYIFLSLDGIQPLADCSVSLYSSNI